MILLNRNCNWVVIIDFVCLIPSPALHNVLKTFTNIKVIKNSVNGSSSCGSIIIQEKHVYTGIELEIKRTSNFLLDHSNYNFIPKSLPQVPKHFRVLVVDYHVK